MSFVSFGVDIRELEPVDSAPAGPVVSVGYNAGHDWETLFSAVEGTGWVVQIATRPHMLTSTPPAEVEVLGFLDHPIYLELPTNAPVVVLTTRDVAYPSGQTVLLEAMALGKACVVTRTRHSPSTPKTVWIA